MCVGWDSGSENKWDSGGGGGGGSEQLRPAPTVSGWAAWCTMTSTPVPSGRRRLVEAQAPTLWRPLEYASGGSD